jgi:2-methylcitrate dehydratase PrpD
LTAPLGLTAWLGAYIASGDPTELHPVAVESVRHLILDCVGCMLAGASEPASRIVTSSVKSWGGNPVAAVIGGGVRTSPVAAALANGTAAHALDLDDSHHPGFLHPSAPLFPALLATAEACNASGLDVVAGYLYGLDVIAGIGNAINPHHYSLGWHATSTIGTLAAAAGAAKVRRLPAGAVSRAIAIAASNTGGVRRNFGSMTKPLHAGLAASAGVIAAELAAGGLSTGDEVLEGNGGWLELNSAGRAWTEDAVREPLDHGFRLALEGLAIKRFAACGVTHPPIEAMLELRNQHGLRPEHVSRIRLVVNPLVPGIANHHRPRTGLEAKFSLEHCLAVAMVDGAAGLAQFTDSHVQDAAVKAIAERVKIEIDPAVGMAHHMSWGCRLTVDLVAGGSVTTEVELAKGKWLGVRLSEDEVVAKFVDCAQSAGAGDLVARETATRVLQLERISNLRQVTEPLLLS